MSSQRFDPSSNPADLRQELGRKRTDIESNATFLTFEPGLYAIDFRCATSSMSDVGLPLPCARLESVANPASPGRAFVSMTPEGGWLSRATATAHVLVVGGRAGAVLTLYRPTDGTAMPEVQFRSVLASPAVATHQQPMPPSEQTQVPKAPSAGGPEATLLVHVEGSGDHSQNSSEWVGDTKGQRSIEGFALSMPAGMAASSLEYQGIMGEDWRTPWFESGAFCGSRGLQLPLLGFRLRLVGAAAEAFECRAWGQFARQGIIGPVASGEDCNADNMPLTAMKVEIIAKSAAPLPSGDATSADEPEPPAPPDPVDLQGKKPRWRRPRG